MGAGSIIIIENEAWALIRALQHFNMYLGERGPTLVYTTKTRLPF